MQIIVSAKADSFPVRETQHIARLRAWGMLKAEGDLPESTGRRRGAMMGGALLVPLLYTAAAAAAVATEPLPAANESGTTDSSDAFHAAGPGGPVADPRAEPPAASQVSQPSARRPRFSAAVGMGVALDDSGFVRGRTVPVPAFHVQLGAGGGVWGFELRLIATQAAGRYHDREVDPTGTLSAPDMPPDRLALDALLAVRPLTWRYRDSDSWAERILRTLALTVGLSAENASIGVPAVIRWGPVVGAQVDFPLVGATGSTQLGLRVGARRMFGGEKTAGMVVVRDTQDFLGGLVLDF